MTAPTPDSSPGAAADLARLVGTALAHRADTDTSREDAAEIQAITDAMVRLLIGAPLHKLEGQLASEAGVSDLSRHRLRPPTASGRR